MTKSNTFSHQTDSTDSVQHLRFNLVQSVSWLNDETRQFLRPYGVTPKQYSILANLARQTPESLSIQQVRDALADKMSDASRLIDRLVKKDYLEKFPSDHDRRSNRVRISPKGLRLLQEINAHRERLEGIIRQRLDPEEIVQLNLLLSRLK